MKIELCPNCNHPMKLVKVLDEKNAVMKCKHCQLQKQFVYEENAFPPSINKFNWGAFALWHFWGFGNKMSYLFVVYFVLSIASASQLLVLPVLIITLAISFYLGFKGNKLSWEKKDWASIERFEKIQHRWNVAGIVVILVPLIIALILVLVLMGV